MSAPWLSALPYADAVIPAATESAVDLAPLFRRCNVSLGSINLARVKSSQDFFQRMVDANLADDGGPAVLVHAPLWGWRQESVTWLVTDSTLRGYVDRICAEVIRGAYDAAEDLDEAPSLVDGAVPEWAIDRGGDDMAASIAEARARWGQAAADEVAAFIGVDA